MNNILIAEDELRIASFLEKGLKKSGFTTTVAEDGQKAIDLANNNDFELLLLDLGLPVKDGFTVLEELRSRNTQIPIIVVSALSDEKIRHDALFEGANDYINKPFSFQDLVAKIKLYLKS